MPDLATFAEDSGGRSQTQTRKTALRQTCDKPGKAAWKPAANERGNAGKPAANCGSLRGILETCRKHTETCRNPAGNLQEPTGNQQETCRKPARSPQVTHGKLGKLAVWKLAQKPKRNPQNTLGRKRAKETCTKLSQTCSKAVETRRKHACGKLGNPASREQLGYLRCRNLPAVNCKTRAKP